MNKDFEIVKDQLAKHLLRIDLDKLSMRELSDYSEIVAKLNPLYEEKTDYFATMSKLMNAGICGQKPAPVPTKEV